MAEYTVRLGNGRVVKRDLPDGATDEQVRQAFAADYQQADRAPVVRVAAPQSAPTGQQASISSADFGWRDRLAQGASSIAGQFGLDERGAYRGVQGLLGAADYLPFVGDAATAGDAVQSFQDGSPLKALAQAGLAGVGVVPGVGDGLAALGKAGLAKLGAGGGAGLSALMGSIRAYHGSPHDFDRFSLDKIGTGEGAQAYGHGLYFAGNEEVAKQYREQLAGDGFVTGRGEVFDPYRDLQHPNVRAPLSRTGDLDASIARARELLPTANEQTRPMLEADLAKLEALQASGGIRKNDGHLYEVEIDAEPEDLLDWDKPLSQHPEQVQAALEPLLEARLGKAGSNYRFHTLGGTDDPLGRDIYRNLDTGGGAVSQQLRDAGIRGLQYFDGFSRGPQAGSRNYVVFDDKLVDVKRKY